MGKIKKEIIFIYSDSAEKSMYLPIGAEAETRGFKVSYTMNVFEKCEIGFYCQHQNHPQYSKLSVIMLHDIIQQYSNWPDIWFREPWNKYDIGILPSYQWEQNWNQCSQWFYARPRKGMYKVGWPKADVVVGFSGSHIREEIFKQYKLDKNKKTVLYAPAWENDGKQDDFVKAMLRLNVNILIKQAPWDQDQYPQIAANVAEMYEIHKDISGVVILPPETNIYNAIAVCDILVSEESSTMCEAAMLGIPAVSVSNWLIPDVIPSRYPKNDYSFVTPTTKEMLSRTVNEMLMHYEKYSSQVQQFADLNFQNIGTSSKIIMDIIEDYYNGDLIRCENLVPRKQERLPLSRLFRFNYMKFKRELQSNYCQRNPALRWIYEIMKKCKHLFL
jgi:hypothetical protein